MAYVPQDINSEYIKCNCMHILCCKSMSQRNKEMQRKRAECKVRDLEGRDKGGDGMRREKNAGR